MDYSERINLLLDMVATRDARIMKLREEATDHIERIDVLQDNITNRDARIVKLSRDVDDIGDHNTTLQATVDNRDARIVKLREETTSTVDMNTALHTMVCQRDAKIKQMHRETTKLKGKLGTALADLRKINQNTFAENYAKLESELEACQNECKAVSGRNIALWSQHQAIRDAMATLHNVLEE
jgi:chromosome segregation ATPase